MMKTKMIFKASKYITLLVIALIFSGCPSDDNNVLIVADCDALPANLLGVYTGELSVGTINDATGTVTIASAGTDENGCASYSATFSEETLNNSNLSDAFDEITFRQDGNQYMANHAGIGSQTLIINTTDNTLQIQVGSISFNGTQGDGGDTGGDGNATVLDLDLDKGVLFGIDVELTDVNTYLIPVILGTNDTSFDQTEEEFTGTGNVIILDFYSNTPTLTAGTYTFNTNEEAFTFDGDVENVPDNDQGYTIEAGAVTVSYIGSEAVIEYDLSLDSDVDTSNDIDATTQGNFREELFQLGNCFVSLPDTLLGTFDGIYADGDGTVTISLESDGTYTISYSNGSNTTTNISFCREEDQGDVIYTYEELLNGGTVDISLIIFSDGEIEIDILAEGVTFSNQV